METIPLVDDQTEEQHDTAAPIETALDGHEPLAVEALEDRVLLASDAAIPAGAAVAESAPVEPVAFVAPQHADHVAVDLGDALEAGDTSSGSEQTPTSSGPAQRSAHAGESHAEAHVVEEKSELPEQPTREANETMEHESNRSRFGLATIEPEPEKAPQEAELNAEPGNGGQGRTNEIGATEAGAERVAAHGAPEVAEAAVEQVADELATKMAPSNAIAPLIEPALTSPPLANASQAHPSPANEQTEAIVRTILQTEAETDTLPTAAATPIGDEAGAAQETPAAALASAQQSDHNAGLSASVVLPSVLQTSAETPAAAHDALFAGGQGVEAVLERPSA